IKDPPVWAVLRGRPSLGQVISLPREGRPRRTAHTGPPIQDRPYRTAHTGPPIQDRRFLSHAPLMVDYSRCQERNHDLVMPDERKPTAAACNRAPHYIGQRAILLNEIKVSGRKTLELLSKVANDSHCLQKDFGQYNGGT